MTKYRVKQTTISRGEFEVEIDDGGYFPNQKMIFDAIESYIRDNCVDHNLVKDTYEIVRKD